MERSVAIVEPEELARITSILPHFLSEQSLLRVTPLGDGNINDTYLAEFPNRSPVVLQMINAAVFTQPTWVAGNVSMVTQHLGEKQSHTTHGDRWLRVFPALDGKSYYRDDTGGVWRVISYIENSISYSMVQSDAQAFEGGWMLGRFHHLLDDFDPGLLHNSLPEFHNLPRYWRRYQEALIAHRRSPSVDLLHCIRQAKRMEADVCLFEKEKNNKTIVCRVIHGDPKLDNILFDKDTDRAVSMIDLDTVSSGLLQYDLGDCLRSFCNPAGEQPASPEEVRFDIDICERVLAGYKASGADITQHEKNLVYQGVRLLTFELALRFFTDFLEGDHYFKVADGQENLRRAMAQFQLLDSIGQQQRDIEMLIGSRV